MVSMQLHRSEIGWTYFYRLAAVHVYSQLHTQTILSALRSLYIVRKP